jgi:membrane protein DedA with SNARE-associated domain
MKAIAAAVVEWLAAYTYPVVFVGTLIDASGFPFPGRLLLVAAGALAGAGRQNVVVVIGLGALAAMLMDQVWYLAAARAGDRVLALLRRLAGSARIEDDDAVDYFARYGAATILVGRFFTSVRVLAWPVAAARGIGYPKFFVLDVFAATAWTTLGGWWASDGRRPRRRRESGWGSRA